MLDVPNIAFDLLFSLAFFILLWLLMPHVPKKGEATEGGRGRIELFDALKGVAIVAVVLMHTQGAIPYFWLYSLAVPIFVMASGYLLMRRYGEKFGLAQYFWKIVLRIVLVYFALVVALRALTGFSLSPAEIAWDMAFGRTPYIASAPANYFVPMIILLYIIYPLLARLGRRLADLRVMLLIFAAAFFFKQVYDFLEPAFYMDSVAYAANIVFAGRYLFVFAFGAGLCFYDFEKMEARGKNALAAVALAMAGVGTLGFYFAGFAQNAYVMPALLLVLALAAYRHAGAASDWLSRLGRASLIIYLIHWAVFYFIRNRVGLSPLDRTSPAAVAVSLAVLAASFALAEALGWALKKAKKMLGKKEGGSAPEITGKKDGKEEDASKNSGGSRNAGWHGPAGALALLTLLVLAGLPSAAVELLSPPDDSLLNASRPFDFVFVSQGGGAAGSTPLCTLTVQNWFERQELGPYAAPAQNAVRISVPGLSEGAYLWQVRCGNQQSNPWMLRVIQEGYALGPGTERRINWIEGLPSQLFMSKTILDAKDPQWREWFLTSPSRIVYTPAQMADLFWQADEKPYPAYGWWLLGGMALALALVLWHARKEFSKKG